jgi:hypothetical protein
MKLLRRDGTLIAESESIRAVCEARTDLSYADLSDANLDFSCWPLWCGSLKVKLDKKQQRQLVYHALAVSPNAPGVSRKLRDWANQFHRVGEVPKLAGKKAGSR